MTDGCFIYNSLKAAKVKTTDKDNNVAPQSKESADDLSQLAKTAQATAEGINLILKPISNK